MNGGRIFYKQKEIEEMRNSKPVLFVFIVLVALLLTSCGSAPKQVEGCLGDAKTALQDLNCQEVTIAVENAYLPFNYVLAKTGEAGGWDYDAWRDICTRLHCKPVFKEAAWDGMIQAVSQGQFNTAADGISITAERAKVVDYSISYITVQQRLLVRKGENRFQKIEDIVADPKLKLGTQTGTTNYEVAAKYLPENRISGFETFPFAVQALIAGDIDAVEIDEVAGTGYTGVEPDKVELIGPAIDSGGLGFVYPKGSKLVEPVNKALEAMKADGTLDKLAKKYFGPDFKISDSDLKK
jgi:polar amino acid transport system substrate-binding protein